MTFPIMKLRAWLDRENVTAEAFGQRVDSSAHTVHAWCQGTRRPSKSKMPLIVRETRGAVTPNDFFDIGTGEAA
jgi:DNA-binding transcriptional regulator YiaG